MKMKFNRIAMGLVAMAAFLMSAPGLPIAAK